MPTKKKKKKKKIPIETHERVIVRLPASMPHYILPQTPTTIEPPLPPPFPRTALCACIISQQRGIGRPGRNSKMPQHRALQVTRQRTRKEPSRHPLVGRPSVAQTQSTRV